MLAGPVVLVGISGMAEKEVLLDSREVAVRQVSTADKAVPMERRESPESTVRMARPAQQALTDRRAILMKTRFDPFLP